MPRAKKTTKSTRSSRSKAIPGPALTKAYESEMSYETRVIVVILLLLFVYPVGLICMWAWMRDWPLWLKLLISIPLFLGVLLFFAGVMLLGTFVSSANRAYRLQQMQERMQRHELQLNPTDYPMMHPTDTAVPNTY